MLEIAGDVCRDYLEEVFDRWVSDPSASFQAAELEGEVVGVQRLRPIAAGVGFYEGLQVAPERRRQGIARAMLRQALREAPQLGFREVRLYTGSLEAARLFESEGFRLAARCQVWRAGRMEGDDLPRLAFLEEAAGLAERFRDDPGLAAYDRLDPNWHAVLEVDADLLARLAGAGRVRVGPQRGALALLREQPRSRLAVTLVAGSGVPLQELLAQLRFEADLQGLRGVCVLLPDGHPGAEDMAAVGYDLARDEGVALVYRREL